MTLGKGSAVKETGSSRYEIRVQDHLAPHRLCCFEGLTVTHLPDGETRIVGPFRDQSALYGLLNHICCLGVTLLSVNRLAESGGEEAEKSIRPKVTL
jgi:hypothetical protein